MKTTPLSRRLGQITLVVFGLCLVGALPLAMARQADRRLSLDDVLGTGARIDYRGSVPNLRWLRTPGLSAPTLLEERRVSRRSPGASFYQVDPHTGRSTPLYEPEKMEAALATLPGVDSRTAKLIPQDGDLELNENDTLILVRYANDLYLYDIAGNRAARLTDSPEVSEEEVALAPDGRHIAFVRDNNLWVADVEWGAKAVAPPRALTKDGTDKILNGRLDWVYEEEVYGRGNTSGFRWSPDGKRIAFLRLDESPVTPFVIVDHLTPRQETESETYPKAGDPNPIATLGVVDIAGPSPRYVDLSAYPEKDRLVVRFGWTPDSRRVLGQVQDRAQTFLHLLSADPTTGRSSVLLRETSPAWVDPLGMPRYLTDGTFLWQSERTGHRHIYHYRPDGNLIRPVTQGEWDVRDLDGVDEKRGWVYISASEHSAVAPHTYRVRLQGTDFKRLSEREGSHTASFDPTCSLYLDRWSDLRTPTQLRLHEASSGKEVRLIEENTRPRANLAGYALSTPELVTVKARDGFPLDAVLLKPTNFDPNRRYPVFCDVYAGPASPRARDSWGTVTLWHQYLAQQGVVVWMCDNRSAGGHGARAVWSVHKNFGAGELRDIEDGLNWLKQQSWVDGSRIGISGWSFGGYMVEYALTHSKSFKLGVAGAGVSDWRLYDTIYTERYMGTPEQNPEGYRNSSPTEAAANLSGQLLLLHGTMDDNVHLQNTIRFVDALARAGKDYELALYPRSRHGISDPALSRHMRRRMTSFILDNL